MSSTLKLEETKVSLERIQNFDTVKFDRKTELGAQLNLESAIEPARKVIALFKRIPPEMMSEFPERLLEQVKAQADQVFNAFKTAEEFNTSVENPTLERTNIINTIQGLYDPAFQALFNVIAYSAARATDFQRLEAEGRAAVQAVADKTAELSKNLEESQSEANAILADVRKTAAEQGVSQQAIYFKEESEYHDERSKDWLRATLAWGAAVLLFAIGSIFLHKIPYFSPTNAIESWQLISSKVLIFAVLGYLLLLSARTFLAHRHNAITNKHRQNALVTFQALVDAGQTKESRDTVLRFAASSVFSPQDTGVIRGQAASGGGANTLIELGSNVSEASSG
ncbi:MAG: hypothetical protein AAF550_13340 [Myxococcota bacterium]